MELEYPIQALSRSGSIAALAHAWTQAQTCSMTPDASDVHFKKVTLAILTGGAGRRMGMPKAWMEIGGKAVLRCIHEAMRWPGPTMLVTVPGRERPPGAELFGREVSDPAEAGPLRGVLTALENCQTAELCVMPLDMPLVGRDYLAGLLGELRGRADALGVMFQRRMGERMELEPLPLACRHEAGNVIAEQLRAGDRSLRGIMKHPGFLAVDAPPEWPVSTWRNLNTPDDL